MVCGQKGDLQVNGASTLPLGGLVTLEQEG